MINVVVVAAVADYALRGKVSLTHLVFGSRLVEVGVFLKFILSL